MTFWHWPARQVEIEAAMVQAITPALPYFQQVWILWKARLYGPWDTKDLCDLGRGER